MTSDERDAGPQRPGARLLNEYTGQRRRVVDDHMFAVDLGLSRPSTFRLQLFTGEDLRPVAVVTQTDAEGTSLVNGAERFVEAVWSAHCPDDLQPPLWITRHLVHVKDDSTGGHWAVERGFAVTRFEVIGRDRVGSPPKWGPGLTDEEVTRLVGGPVDLGRGSRWISRIPERGPSVHFTSMPAVLLPRPELADDRLPCMRAPAVRADQLRWQLRPRPLQYCCWFHSGDWRTAAGSARAILRSARRARVYGEDVPVFGLGKVSELGLAGWQRDAVRSLFLEPIQPSAEIRYVGGRHRALAVLHAGVHLVPVELWETPHRIAWSGGPARGTRV